MARFNVGDFVRLRNGYEDRRITGLTRHVTKDGEWRNGATLHSTGSIVFDLEFLTTIAPKTPCNPGD